MNIFNKNFLIKLFVVFFIIYYFIANSNYALANLTLPQIYSPAAILVDTNTGNILYDKNSNQKMYPASTTKILTAIIVLENTDLNEVVTVSEYAVTALGDEYSKAFLQYNEQLTVEQLLQLLLVISANDAAIALAEHVGGSVDSFVSMMNSKVYDLGLSNSNFTNCYGGHDDNQYTTAYDLYTIMDYCLNNNDFRRISGSASIAIPATNMYDVRKYISSNDLIVPNTSGYYPYVTTGKTGFTTPAGHCLVSSSYHNNLELICVILGGNTIGTDSSRFIDTRTLYNYAYDNYSYQNILNESQFLDSIKIDNAEPSNNFLNIVAKENISILLPNNTDIASLPYTINLNSNLHAPIVTGETVGTITFTIDNIEYTSELIAGNEVKLSKILYYIIAIFTIIFAIIIFTYLYALVFKKDKIKKIDSSK